MKVSYILLSFISLFMVYYIKNSGLLYGFAYYIIPIFVSLSTLIFFNKYLRKKSYHFLSEKYEIISLVLAGIIPSFIMGFVTGFGLNILTITVTQFITNALYFLSFYALIELLRYNITNYVRNSNLYHIILIALLMTFFEIPLSKFIEFHPPFILEFISLLSVSIVYTIIASRYSFLHLLIIRLSTVFMLKLFPILPDMQWYISIQITLLSSIIQLTVLYLIFNFPGMSRTFTRISIFNKTLRTKRSKTLKKLGKILMIVMILLISFSLLLGYRFLVISSGSMVPTIKIGDLVVVRESDNIQEGDIVAFVLKDNIVIHRVIKIDNDVSGNVYYTKGDALSRIDPWRLSKKNILGKAVFIVTYAGFPLVYMMRFFGDYITSVIATITFILALNIVYISKELVQYI